MAGTALNKFMVQKGMKPREQAAASMKNAFGYKEKEPEEEKPEYEGFGKEITKSLKRKAGY